MNELIYNRIKHSFDKQGFQKTLGVNLDSVTAGKISLSCEKKISLTQQMGYIHGGVIGAIADTAGGYAAMSIIPKNYNIVTAEYKINFLRPAVGDKIIAKGKVIKSGKKIIVTEVEVTDVKSEQLIAKMVQTVTVVRDK